MPAYIEVLPADRPTHMLGRPIERLVTHDGDLGDFVAVTPALGWRPDPARGDQALGMGAMGRKFGKALRKGFKDVGKVAKGAVVGLAVAGPVGLVAGAAVGGAGLLKGKRRSGGGATTYLDEQALERTYLPPGAQGPYAGASYGQPYGAPYGGMPPPPPEALYGPSGEPLYAPPTSMMPTPAPVPQAYDPYAPQAQAWGQTYGDPSGAGFDPYTQSYTTQYGEYGATGGTLMDAPAPSGRGARLLADLRTLVQAERALVQADKDVVRRAAEALGRCRARRSSCRSKLAACKAGADQAMADVRKRGEAARLVEALRALVALDRALEKQERKVVQDAADTLSALRERLSKVRERLRACRARA